MNSVKTMTSYATKINLKYRYCEQATIMDQDMAARVDQAKIFSFRLRSATDQITQTVRQCDHILEKDQCCTSQEINEISTALSEALANAIIHGNKLDPDKYVALKIKICRNKIQLIVTD
ncbi:MAG TPA: hypothetical protein ENN22_06675 [bacterium]|nr:hypothetical protein [bacterium]